LGLELSIWGFWDLEHGNLPDPEGQLIDDLTRRIEQLEEQIRLLAEERLAERR